MHKYFYLAIILVFGLISCSPDEPGDDNSFAISAGSVYDVYLGGETHDTTYSSVFPNRQVTFADGKKKLRGRLEVTSTTEDLHFFGFLRWDDVIYSEEIEQRTRTNGIWDTTFSSFSNQLNLLEDSAIAIEGYYTARYLHMDRDTLPLLYTRKSLEFDILTFTDKQMRSFAGYPDIQTTVTGHPDSTTFYYQRQVWELDTIRIEPQ